MKVIDLYVMVSKGEQPKKFKYRNEWWAYSVSDCDFRTLKQKIRDADMPTYEYLMSIIDTSNLNDEIEIIEEVEDSLIPEHITNEFIQSLDSEISNGDIKHIAHKVNGIINYLQHILKENKE